MKATTLACGILALGTGVLMMCGTNDNPSGGGNTVTGTTCNDVETYRANYTQKGDTLFGYKAGKTDTVRTCQGATLSSTPRTVPADSDTILTRISGADLWASEDSVNAVYSAFVGAFVAKARDIRFYWVLKRIGAGSGITGTWLVDSIAYYDSAATLNLIEKAVVDSFVKVFSTTYLDTTERIQVTGSEIVTYTPWKAAKDYMAAWRADSATHAITADSLSACQVRLTGQHSSEIVTITGDGDGNTLYHSTNANHADYTYYKTNPVRCPNTQYPDWWAEFEQGNLK